MLVGFAWAVGVPVTVVMIFLVSQVIRGWGGGGRGGGVVPGEDGVVD